MRIRPTPNGWTKAIACFFGFGTVASGLAAFLLLLPGSPLDALWKVNPRGREGLMALGLWAVLLMLVVCACCATAVLGLWRARRWGLWMAVAVLSTNLIGDTINVFVLHDWRTLIGLPIGGLMIVYLVKSRRDFE